MNRAPMFDSPFLLGFEHTRTLIERAAKAAAESYPPDNVEETGTGRVRITLAVAGFTPDQLQVTVEARQLIVAGRKEADQRSVDDKAYLHRGIAARGRVGGGAGPAGARPSAHRPGPSRAGSRNTANPHSIGRLNRRPFDAFKSVGGGHDDAAFND